MEHGKRSTYVAGCRCEACRAAEAEYQRKHRLAGRKTEDEEVVAEPDHTHELPDGTTASHTHESDGEGHDHGLVGLPGGGEVEVTCPGCGAVFEPGQPLADPLLHEHRAKGELTGYHSHKDGDEPHTHRTAPKPTAKAPETKEPERKEAKEPERKEPERKPAAKVEPKKPEPPKVPPQTDEPEPVRKKAPVYVSAFRSHRLASREGGKK